MASSLDDECRLPGDTNALYDLSHLSMIHIEGDRAAEFLQGQISCDVNQVTSSTIRQGLFCNLKGRIQAIADVINWHGYQLVLPADLIPGMMANLAKTALVSRVKPLHNTNYHIYGLYLANGKESLPVDLNLPVEPFATNSTGDTCCYSLGNQCYIILTRQSYEHLPLRGSLAWHRLRLSLGQVEIYPETQGLFLPHRLDLHKKGYISFDKGCYKGQEIIARTHYRAKLKHGLKLFSIDKNEPLAAGNKIFDPASGIEVGELIDFCPTSTERELIAVSILHDHAERVLFEGHRDNTLLLPVDDA